MSTRLHRFGRSSYLENHPSFFIILILLWEPFQTALFIWEALKRKAQQKWQIYYLAPKEQAIPREQHLPFQPIDRPLTPPLNPPMRIGRMLSSRRQQTYDQDESILFKLPPEIRIMVWKEVLSGNCAYPIDKQNFFYLQKKAIDRNTRHIAWSLSQPNPKLFNIDNGLVSKPHLLGLPLTCRRIYAETIDILYSSNIFHFRSGSGVLGVDRRRMFVGMSWPMKPTFAWRVLPQRFDNIRCLILQHDIYYSPVPSRFLECWFRLCRSLCTLPSLRALRIELDPRPGLQHHFAAFGVTSNSPPPRMPDSIYMPLCSIQHLDIFDVIVFSTEGEDLPIPSMQHIPFRLAIAEYALPRLRRRRSFHEYHHRFGSRDLIDAERWMRNVLLLMRTSLV